MVPPLLDLSPRVEIANKVRARFSTSVHSLDPSHAFHLVVSFGHSSFHLNVENIGIALKACTGGDPTKLYVSHIRGQVYKFSVISKVVGFMIYCLRSFSCPNFSCHFHLWGFGGPSWVREFNLWLYELGNEWTTVSRSNHGHLTGANAIPIGTRPSNPPPCSTPAANNSIPSSSDHVPTAGGIHAIQNSIPGDPATRPIEPPQPSTTPLLTRAQPPPPLY